MRWLIRAYAVILLAYTGWRTYDFMVHQLPAGDLSVWLAILFLFATEAGLMLWHEISIRHTTTREQHYISIMLTWTDFVGSLAAGTADMILRQTFAQGYVIPPALSLFLLYGLPAIVAANVAAVLYYLSNDAETQLDRAKKELRFEITRQALRELKDNEGAIAEGLKKDIFRKIRDDVTGRIAKEFLNNVRLPVDVISNNGGKTKVEYPAETETNPTSPSRRRQK
jgi:hypothetical protein